VIKRELRIKKLHKWLMLNKREYKAKIKEYEELVAQREQHPDKPNQIQSE